jgi:hypothetical protein
VSETRYAGRLTWQATRKTAAVLRAARVASGKRQQDVAAVIGWSTAKVQMAETAVTRLTPADALVFAEAVGIGEAELNVDGQLSESRQGSV